MTFHNVRLPDDIEQGAAGGPQFQTTIIPLSSGGEQRNQDWSEARHSWELGYGISNKVDYATVRSFFFARRGMAHTFLFKDWSDFQVTEETQGIGDAVNQTFQLIKIYTDAGPAPYIRRITRPITGTVVWKVNGVITAATHQGLGVYLFAVAPAALAIVTATFEFDMCVRFNVDQFSLTLQQVDAGQVSSLPIIEVRE